jgi:hypothetical protein
MAESAQKNICYFEKFNGPLKKHTNSIPIQRDRG